MNSRIYSKETYGTCLVDFKDMIYGTKKYFLKKDYVHNNILFYKKGDVIECNGYSFAARSKYVEGRFLVFIERPSVESFLKEYCYTLAEWRDIQINSILED